MTDPRNLPYFHHHQVTTSLNTDPADDHVVEHLTLFPYAPNTHTIDGFSAEEIAQFHQTVRNLPNTITDPTTGQTLQLTMVFEVLDSTYNTDTHYVSNFNIRARYAHADDEFSYIDITKFIKTDTWLK